MLTVHPRPLAQTDDALYRGYGYGYGHGHGPGVEVGIPCPFGTTQILQVGHRVPEHRVLSIVSTRRVGRRRSAIDRDRVTA